MKSGRKEGESAAAFFLRNVAAASFSGSVGEALTIPIDTAKVRLQVQTVQEGVKPKYVGLLGTTKTIAAEEGPVALWNGLSAGLQR